MIYRIDTKPRRRFGFRTIQNGSTLSEGHVERRLGRYFTHPDERRYEKYLKPHVERKRVLDVGCVQHDADAESSQGWTHGLIREDASRLRGIDILEEELETLEERGYDVTHADAQDFELDETYDVIFLGEVIEHLTSFDGLFESIDDHLTDDGVVIITTPNALSIYWSLVTFSGQSIVNPEHTCWFDESTLSQLMVRFGFEPVEVHHARMSRLRGVRSVTGAIGWLGELCLPDRIAHRNLVVVAKRT